MRTALCFQCDMAIDINLINTNKIKMQKILILTNKKAKAEKQMSITQGISRWSTIKVLTLPDTA